MRPYSRLASVAVVATLFASSFVAGAEELACRSQELPVKPSWLSSAAWYEPSGELLAAEPTNGRIIAYSWTTNSARVLDDVRVKKEGEFHPTKVRRANGTAVVKLVDSEIIKLPSNSSGVVQLDLSQDADRFTGVGSLYDWSVAGDRLIAYGSVRARGRELAGKDVHRPDLDFELGFFTYRFDRPGESARMLLPFPQNQFYLLGLDTIAARAEDAFFLAFSDRPEIYQVRGLSSADPETHRFLGMPRGFETLAPLASFSSDRGAVTAIFQDLERRPAMPMGLYTWSGRLFLLTREAVADGARWLLHEIDTEARRYLHSYRLPTIASQILLVPGDDWYVIEKGTIHELGRQDISSYLRIPGDWLKERSPLLWPNPTVVSCRSATGNSR